jgi:hypothetical protein
VQTKLVQRRERICQPNGFPQKTAIQLREAAKAIAQLRLSQLMLTRDPLIKAHHFQDCAQESLQRAECAQTLANRGHHLTLARHYLLMAEAELQEASKLLARRFRRSKNKRAARTAAISSDTCWNQRPSK